MTRLTRASLIWTCALALATPAFARGFRDLDCESAKIVPVSGGDPYERIQFGPAFPGWSGYTGSSIEQLALYRRMFLDSSGIVILDRGLPYGFQPIEGNFAALLEAEHGLAPPHLPADATLSQTGTVPAGTQSLLFEARLVGDSASALDVTLGGQSLSLIRVLDTPDYTLYGADVNAWAGETAELDFTLHAYDPYTMPTMRILLLDSIRFSSQPIPEPSAFALMAMAGPLLCWHLISGLRLRRSAGVL